MVADANTNQDIATSAIEQNKENSVDYKALIVPQNEFMTAKGDPEGLLQHTFVGWLRRAANNVPTDSAIIKFVNPAGDTIWTKVGRVMQDYYSRTSDAGWINDGDTVKVIASDTTGQTARTFRIVTPTGNRIVTLFPAGHTFLINKVFNTVDSANVKCYSKGPVVWSDTLTQRFDIGLPSDNVYFNREKFSRKPALNDSIIFEITEGSYYARTACQYKRALWDADSAPSCSLKLVGIGEDLENKVEKPMLLIIKPNPAKNYILFNQEVDGYLYDKKKKKIMSIDSDKLDLKKINVPSGVYFIKDDKKKHNGKVTIIK